MEKSVGYFFVYYSI